MAPVTELLGPGASSAVPPQKREGGRRMKASVYSLSLHGRFPQAVGVPLRKSRSHW